MSLSLVRLRVSGVGPRSSAGAHGPAAMGQASGFAGGWAVSPIGQGWTSHKIGHPGSSPRGLSSSSRVARESQVPTPAHPPREAEPCKASELGLLQHSVRPRTARGGPDARAGDMHTTSQWQQMQSRTAAGRAGRLETRGCVRQPPATPREMSNMA